jgi:hypothetical protein
MWLPDPRYSRRYWRRSPLYFVDLIETIMDMPGWWIILLVGVGIAAFLILRSAGDFYDWVMSMPGL